MPENGTWRPTCAEVDLENIRHNVRLYVELAGPRCQVMAVVKADGYGHGDVEVSRAALQAGASRLGVALVEEAERLRDAGLDVPIHLLFEPPPAAAGRVVELGLIPTVYNLEYARELSRAARAAGLNVAVHVKVDTGMHRVGVAPAGAAAFAKEVSALPGLEIEGLYTHLATASEPGHPFTLRQWETFTRVLETFEKQGIDVPLRHVAASGAALSLPEARLEMVRLGIAMYGLLPGEGYRGMLDLRPAMALRSRIARATSVLAGEGVGYGLTHTFADDTRVALLPVGYADGLRRGLSNRWQVLIDGKAYPLVGTVCMDLCMIDLGGEDYPAGTQVTVMGGYGEDETGAQRMAEVLGTINYEVICGIGKRVPRVYRNRL